MMTSEALDDVSTGTSRQDDRLGFSERRPKLVRDDLSDDRARTLAMPAWRRKPRVSLIVVLPDGSQISPAQLTDQTPARSGDARDVIVACAGRPVNFLALQAFARDAQFLFAPAGTPEEELRELAMQHASGDIVTLVSGARVTGPLETSREYTPC